MSEYNISKTDLLSESDVEQKIIYPLLTNPQPLGLGYNNQEIQTKVNLKKLQIDKGKKSSLYYPDYLITINGVPSIIVEAKRPDEDLNEAFRQAALYSAEINRFFEDEINPCKYIIACDGLSFLAGTWDNAKPAFNLTTQNWEVGNDEFSSFFNMFSKDSIERHSTEIRTKIRKDVSFKKPLHLIGGKNIQNKQIKNSFGETISIQYRHLFNPNVDEEKADIVKNAYVHTNKHQSHVTPIDRLIRKKVLSSVENSTLIKSSENPTELLSKLQEAHNYNNQVLLLIGSVGSGKSTFTTYLKEVALDKQLIEKLVWVTLDLNNAPVNSKDIYSWIINNLTNKIKASRTDIDFDDFETIKEIFKLELEKFDKLAGALLDKKSETYRIELFRKITELQASHELVLHSIISTFLHSTGKNLVIVLDNCDKRNLEEQLLMFEVANWIKETIKAIVFLPLRDTTYDHFKKEKPLDTVIKDLIFRITPAPLEQIIYNRIKYATRLSEKNENRYYTLDNNIKVSYPAKQELYYLKSIITSLFQNHFFKKLITGLTGSDIRHGIEIFLDFCKSGHITDSEIFKIKQSKGEHILPRHVVSKVFFRGDRVFYNDESSRVKNLFYSDPSDKIPNPFVRIEILKWLHSKYRTRGLSGILGFHRVDELISDLITIGFERDRVEKEILNLIRHRLIISESQDSNSFKLAELISINIPGIIHLELLNNIDYLSSCSEDTWFSVVDIATQIAKNISGTGKHAHLSLENVIEHSELLINYLSDYHNSFFEGYLNYLSDNKQSFPLKEEEIRSIISNEKSRIAQNTPKLLDAGTKLNAKVTKIMRYGLFLKLSKTNKVGFISERELSDIDYEIMQDDNLVVEIINFSSTHNKYEVKIAKIEEENF
ncbi:type I restriction enzyme HsdR N-terminal domain-containing protein [Flavobacterium sp. LHD-80]|uniref:type I restriction enzyme HsdR N-terminal domain-containing protein n=1 Tax=Flavobacterium sp. LHD-80 TaxID=3071411 RepID=UPI0027E0099D|nr:type I restriction enzyme HsdR N-terminal domain-containing protein [Flavobacterium sp. LHD-80]MDQ6469214.1 type I restriction enzyme HsdR N-terminal domain-containing protein [Flavobacterium sp. LHD-80]